MKYRNLFFDLDDTIWAFSRNARDTFEEVYRKYSFERYFDSFDHYYTIYQQRNTELWIEYGEGKITKDELNRQRFSYPLQAVGVEDETLAEKFSEDFFAIIPTKSGLMPYAKEVLEYLVPKYNLCKSSISIIFFTKLLKIIHQSLLYKKNINYLHRRADKVRIKHVHNVSCEIIDDPVEKASSSSMNLNSQLHHIMISSENLER